MYRRDGEYTSKFYLCPLIFLLYCNISKKIEKNKYFDHFNITLTFNLLNCERTLNTLNSLSKFGIYKKISYIRNVPMREQRFILFTLNSLYYDNKSY